MLYTSSSSFVHVDLSVLRCRKSPHARCYCCSWSDAIVSCYWCCAAASSRSFSLAVSASIVSYRFEHIPGRPTTERGTRACVIAPNNFISAPIISQLVATLCLLGWNTLKMHQNAPNISFPDIFLIRGRGLRSLPGPHPQGHRSDFVSKNSEVSQERHPSDPLVAWREGRPLPHPLHQPSCCHPVPPIFSARFTRTCLNAA